MNKAVRETDIVNATLESLRALEDIKDDMQDVETGQRGYIISGNKVFLEPYFSALKELSKDTIAVKVLDRLYPERKAAFAQLIKFVKQKTDITKASILVIEQFGTDSAYKRVQSGKGREVMDSIRNIIFSFENEDRLVLQKSNEQRGIAARATAKLFISLAVIFIAGLIIFFLRVNTGLKQREVFEQKISYLAELTEKTSDAIFSTDAGMIIKSWNNAAREMYGYLPDEAIGQRTGSLLKITSNREDFDKSLADLKRQGFYKGEYSAIKRSGETVFIQASVSVLRNEKNEIDGYVAVHRDITEKKKSEQLLKNFNAELEKQVEEKSALINSILERISDGFYSLDANWCFTYINSYAEGIMERQRGELVGKHLWTEFPDALNYPVYQVFEKSFKEQQYGQLEFYYDPFKKWLMVHIYPSLSGISVFFRDVSAIRNAQEEMKRSSERFDMISRTTNDAIWEWNLETGEMWGNETHQHLYGLTLADPVPQEKEWQQRIHPDDREHLMKKQEEALASDTNIFITEYRFKTEKEGYKNIYDRCYIVRNEEGKAIRILGSMMDITQRKQAEDLLKKREAQLLASIENTPNVAVQWYNEKGEVLFWNHASELIFGWGASEAMGKTLDHLILTPEDAADFVKTLYQVGQTGKTNGPSEFSFHRKNGSRGYSMATIFSIPSIDGKPCFVCMDIDITESKNAAAALQESEEKYRSMIEQASDGIFILDSEGGYVDANQAGCLMMGYAKSELLNMSARDFLPADAVAINILKAEELAAGQTIVMERRLKKKNGNVFDTEVSYKKLSNGYNLAIARDITEKKKTEEILRASEETRKLIMNSALDAIVCINTAGTITVWTPQAEKLFGWKEADVMGKMLTDTIIPEKYKESHRKGMYSYLQTGNGRVLNRLIEISAVNKAGIEFPIELSITPITQGEYQFFCAFIRDITERKEAAEKIVKEKTLSDTVINSLPGVFYLFDVNRKLLRWNRNFEAVLGYSPDELVQLDSIGFFAEEDRELARQKVENIFRKGSAELEASFLTKTGIKVPYFFTGLAINYEGVPCMLGTGIDITERKIAEAALKSSEEKLRQILSSTAEDFYVIDRDYKVVLINTVAQQNLELVWGKKIATGTFMPDIFPPDKVEVIRANYEKVFAGERIEYEITSQSNGQTLWKRVNYIPVSDANGTITGAYITTKDITEKKQAEEEIIRTNARFQIVSKATSDIVWDWNLLTDELWWNDNYYKGLGYTKIKEIMPVSDWYNHIHPEDVARVRANTRKTFESDSTVWRDEYRYATADNNYLHFLDRGYIIRDKDGKATRMIGSMVDMTLIYDVQRKVAESENRLRTILDTDPECIKLMDADCRLLDINKAGLEMIEADNFENVSGASLLPIVGEGQRQSAEELVKGAFKGDSGRLAFEMITLKGTHRWCEISVVPFKSADGEIINALGVTRDITENKMAEMELRMNEEKYRTLIEQAVDAIALYDANGNVLDVNTGSVNLLGYSKEELVHMSLKEILTGDEIKTNPVQYDVLEQGKSTVKQRRMRKKDGTVVETEVRSQQLPDGRFLSVIRDLTERIVAERELAASYEAIRKLTGHIQNIREEERTNIAREIHDELGQQLTVLKMDVSWLRKKIGASDEAVKLKLKDLITMLDETVKTVRRISSELRPSLLDDLGLVAAMEWQLGEFEKRSAINTSFTNPGDDLQLPDLIKTALFRIFQESLTNVARHSHATKVSVTITSGNGSLVLSIADNGRGFDKQKVAEKKTLGILGMKERIAMIGGNYEIKSGLGKGTEVIVKIPLNNSIN